MGLKELRKALNLTQAEMARVLGYSAKARISEIESGRWGSPQTSRMIELLSFLHDQAPDLLKLFVDKQLKSR